MSFACLQEACRSGNIKTVKLAIKNGAMNWNEGLEYACYRGHIEIVKLIIEHSPTEKIITLIEPKFVSITINFLDWNKGLKCACMGGHIEIAKLMIEHGAVNFNEGLRDACCGGHIELVNLMIKHNATDWDGGLQCACHSGYVNIAILMIKNGANIDLYSLYLTNYSITCLLEHGITRFGSHTTRADKCRSRLNKRIIEEVKDLHIFPEFFHLVNNYNTGIM